MWGDRFPPEINVPRIFAELEEEFIKLVVCEGCGLSAIGKTEEGKLVIAYINPPISLEEVDLDEYIIPKNKRVKLCQKSERSKHNKSTKDVLSVDKDGCDQPE